MTTATIVKVLIVDDNAEDTKFVTDLLKEAKRFQFLPETAATAEEGLALLRRSKFDVVLLDFCLPDMDGDDFLHRVRAERFRTPVVMVTNRGDRATQLRALEQGAAEYLERGTFNGDLLERTCIYAIGIQEKQNSGDGGPGVGVYMGQLVELTRDSVRAQTVAADAALSATESIKDFRQELKDSVKAIQGDIEKHHEAAMGIQTTALGIQDRVIAELQQIGKLRWFLNWAKENPLAAIIIFLCLTTVLVLFIIFFLTATPEQIKAVGEVTKQAGKAL